VFQFRRVPAGSHRLAIDVSTLEAGLAPIVPDHEVRVSAGRRTEVSLSLERLGAVRGRVVDLSSPPPVAPELILNGVVLALSDGRQTTTGRDGIFAFGGLRAGSWTVTLDPGSLPEGYEVRGTARQELVITPGEAAPELEFAIARKPREVRVFLAPPAESSP
jgi:hypothetical protein